MQLNVGDDHLVRGMAYSADVFAGTVYTDVVNMKNWHQVEFDINVELGSTGTSTITVQACDDVVPTNRSAIPFQYQKAVGSDDVPGALTAATSAGFNTTAGAAAQRYRIFVDAADLAASGYSFCQLKAVEVVNDPVAGSVTIRVSKARSKEEIPTTAIV